MYTDGNSLFTKGVFMSILTTISHNRVFSGSLREEFMEQFNPSLVENKSYLANRDIWMAAGETLTNFEKAIIIQTQSWSKFFWVLKPQTAKIKINFQVISVYTLWRKEPGYNNKPRWGSASGNFGTCFWFSLSLLPNMWISFSQILVIRFLLALVYLALAKARH